MTISLSSGGRKNRLTLSKSGNFLTCSGWDSNPDNGERHIS